MDFQRHTLLPRAEEADIREMLHFFQLLDALHPAKMEPEEGDAALLRIDQARQMLSREALFSFFPCLGEQGIALPGILPGEEKADE